MITKLYDDNPNPREVRRIADTLRDGGVVIVPTDTLYAFACSMEHKRAVEEIALLKGYKLKQAKYAMLCSSLSQASEYVRAMDRDTFALLKRCLPGPFTFIMEASGAVPRNYQNSNKTIGIRVPDRSRADSRTLRSPRGCGRRRRHSRCRAFDGDRLQRRDRAGETRQRRNRFISDADKYQ